VKFPAPDKAVFTVIVPVLLLVPAIDKVSYVVALIVWPELVYATVFGLAVAVRPVIPEVPPILSVALDALVSVPAPERAAATVVVPVFDAVFEIESVS
jgi:hypothetical protein